MEDINDTIKKIEEMKKRYLEEAEKAEGKKKEFCLLMAKNCNKQIERLEKISRNNTIEERDL